MLIARGAPAPARAARGTPAAHELAVKETIQLPDSKKATKKKRHLARKLVFLAIVAGAGYYYGFMLDDEKRGRVKKLLFEGREMWFRLFV